MKLILQALVLAFIGCINWGCNQKSNSGNALPMNTTGTIKKQLDRIDSLLQNKSFTVSVATQLDAAYYKGIGQAAPPFISGDEDSLSIEKSIAEEKIAINIAGFYALECGLNYLCSKDSSTPLQWVEKIVSGKMKDQPGDEILNRFANATWKAGQPFRGIDRIGKANFIGWSRLSKEEVEKDRRQIMAAALQLSQLLNGTRENQFNQLKQLLQSKDFALTMAASADSFYYAGENKTAPAFINPGEEKAKKKKSFKEEKIASNLAGFYALECGLNYFASVKGQAPLSVLQSLADGSISKEDRELFCRFANATWKAGQPFRDINRISRATFTPFNFLQEKDIDKDWVQVKTAALVLLPLLK